MISPLKLSIPLLLIGVGMTPAIHAANMSCQQLLDQVKQHPVNSMSYQYQINQAISPKAMNRFETLGEKREVPRGLHDKIRATFNHHLISDCNSNPRQYTYSASEQALTRTKAVVKDYLRHRS
ncbi:MAG: hypothetical protein OQK12_04960 [Motiliproteus sp.]|nr:hypothetical protein [Motiliproteus sp.]MCW9051404.1 hypothetical protein [Motiliproteus sp.]